jgi:dTDP-glucose 4,6-dehydratase
VSWRPQRVLVTGGAGFLGSHLCRRLLDEGCEVIAYDNLLTGRVGNIEALLGHERFEFQYYDVTNFLYVSGDLDAVLHFASPASPADFERVPIQILKVGALGTHKALGLAHEKGARFLLASTSECYGDPEVSPQPESYWGNVNPIGIRGVYDEAKRFAEAMTMAYHRHHGVDARIVRIFNTFGPRMQIDDGRAIPNFFRQAIRGEDVTLFGDGSQTRSAEKIIALTASKSQLVTRPLPPDDPKVRRPDITLAQQVLGDWAPEVSVERGLERTRDYFVEELGA